MTSFIMGFLALIIGVVGGMGGLIFFNLPETEELIVGEEIFYSYNDNHVQTAELTGQAGELSVHFLELGNKYTGDCTYIKYGDIDILIDCGSKTSSISTVESYLRAHMEEGDNVIDYCIVTHAHTDHYAGFATGSKVKSIFDLFEFGTIIDFGTATSKDTENPTGMLKNYITNRQEAIDRSEDLVESGKLAKKTEYFNAATNVKNNNKTYYIGENNQVELEILYNEYDGNLLTSSSENNYSVCTLLTYDDKQMLFTGDLEEHGSGAETLLLQNNQSLKDIQASGDGVELYKAGHHGSSTSSSSNFMAAMKPEIVCVCCCAGSPEYTDTKDNQFPTQQFINTIAPYTTNVFVTSLCVDWDNDEWTSMNGNIVVIALPSQNLTVNGSNNETLLKDTEWFKSNRELPTSWQPQTN